MAPFELSEIQLNLTPFGLGGGSITWARTSGDRKIARSLVAYLEDRRLLFGLRHVEDEMHCISSANAIREFVTNKIMEADPGNQLEAALRVIRRLMREFIDAAGHEGVMFRHRDPYSTDFFSLALGELRRGVGTQLAILVAVYDLDVEEELRQILPTQDKDDDGQQDYSWIPGFGRQV